eukprot:TRINITY_DN1190_c0_g2_i1.p1 TRINITY_DN1190_c0_g2~~TRINITY_DN1190_c0_g2_i1.p1  ORF type:complete len:537 (+),score=84.08 TRINITY_DN1190_c0_g2_i1:31-1641(+)
MKHFFATQTYGQMELSHSGTREAKDPSLSLMDMPFSVSLEDVPLCTLKESFYPLSLLVPQMKSFVSACIEWVKTEFGENLPFGLTGDEAAAINIYTKEWPAKENSLRFKLNSALHKQNLPAITPFLPYMKLLLTAVSKLPSFQSSNNSLFQRFNTSFPYEKGKTFWWWSFSSFTPTHMSSSGADAKILVQVHFRSHVVDIRDFSESKSEEILMLPGRHVTVVNISTANGITIIELEEEAEATNVLPGILIPKWKDPGGRICSSLEEILKEIKKKNRFRIANSITNLYFSKNKIGDDGARLISEAFKWNTTLTSLQLCWNQIGDSGATYLCEALKVNTTLTSLDLQRNDIGDSGVMLISELLKENNTLTCLELSMNDVGEHGVRFLTNSLKVNKSLTDMSISNNKIGESAAMFISEALEVNNTLTSLNLSWCGLGEMGAKFICRALKVNKTLTSIKLSWNKMGENGAKSMSKVLKVNTTLTSLDFSFNKIGENGAIYIYEALQANSTLVNIKLRCNTIGQEMKSKIRAIWKGLELSV